MWDTEWKNWIVGPGRHSCACGRVPKQWRWICSERIAWFEQKLGRLKWHQRWWWQQSWKKFLICGPECHKRQKLNKNIWNPTIFRGFLRIRMSCFPLRSRRWYMFTCPILLNLKEVFLCMAPYLQELWTFRCGNIFEKIDRKKHNNQSNSRNRTIAGDGFSLKVVACT